MTHNKSQLLLQDKSSIYQVQPMWSTFTIYGENLSWSTFTVHICPSLSFLLLERDGTTLKLLAVMLEISTE